jgi:septum formation protein
MTMSTQELVLASGSAIRAHILSQAGVVFRKRPADVDEDAIKTDGVLRGLSPKAVALRLAEAKSVAVSREEPGLVLGADQILQLGRDIISKSKSPDEARERLRSMSGRSHYLHAAQALSEKGRVIWSDVQTAEMTVRRLSDAFIDEYLAAAGEEVLASVGAYQYEGLGAHLFESVNGDYYTVLGLPLLPLLARLRTLGLLKS